MYCEYGLSGIIAYLSTDEHCHKVNEYNLPKETVDLVKDCISKNQTKPSQIQKVITQSQLPPLSNSQLYNLKSRTTQTILGHSSSTFQEIVEWCEHNSDVPSDRDEGFCGNFEYSLNENTSINYVRIFVTTRGLVALMKEESDLVATDATHKTNWNGWPTILLGTVDMARHFHPFGLLLTYSEKNKDFKFGFKSIAKLCTDLNGTDYNPRTLLADNCPAITKGFKKAFDMLPRRRIICWAHAIRNWDGKKFNR